jgi:hypothetical protein
LRIFYFNWYWSELRRKFIMKKETLLWNENEEEEEEEERGTLCYK